jgi:hypothetical protein
MSEMFCRSLGSTDVATTQIGQLRREACALRQQLGLQ